MTNTFTKIAIAAMAAATMLAGVTSSNASGMNALASFKAETTVAKVGFVKKNRNNHRVRRHHVRPGRHHVRPGRHYAKPRHYYGKPRHYYGKPRHYYGKPHHYYGKPRHYYKKPRHYVRKHYTPRVYKPVIAFNQNIFNQQTWLNQIGYNAGVADGKMGSNTRAAVMQFQLAFGMPATGSLTAQQTGILAQQAATVLAQRSQPAVNTVAPQQYVQPVQPTAPAAYAPQVQYAPAAPAPVKPIGFAPTAQPQVQYVPQAQHVPQLTY